MLHLVVVDADEDHAVVAQELAGEAEAGVHHRKPLGVESTVRLLIGGEGAALTVDLACAAQVVLQRLGEIVVVDEIVTGVVGRVDVDHLDLAVIRLL
mgnify:FL=1